MVLYYLCEERVLELNAELTSIDKPLYGATSYQFPRRWYGFISKASHYDISGTYLHF